MLTSGARRAVVGALATLGFAVWVPAAEAVTPVTCSGLSAAMNAAATGDVLQLPSGTCQANVTVTNTAAFTLEGTGGQTVLEPQSGSTTTPIIQSAADVHFTLRGLEFTGASHSAVYLNGLGEAVTIQDDVFTADGGGALVFSGASSTSATRVIGNTFSSDAGTGGLVWFSNAPLVLADNTFTGDSSTIYGGGAAIVSESPNANPVQLIGNTFGGSTPTAGDTANGQGGGAFVMLAAGQSLTLSGNTFEHDTAATGLLSGLTANGGGLFLGLLYGNAPYAVSQDHNVFADNVVNEASTAGPYGGGGEWISGLTVQSTGDSFTGNRVAVNGSTPPYGGALGAIAAAAAGSTPAEPGVFTGRDDLFSGNSTGAGGWGGAIYIGFPAPTPACATACPGSSLTLDDSTVVGNSVDVGSGSEGGAIWGGPHDTLAVNNSIIFGNSPQPEIFGFGSTTPTFAYSDVCNEAGGPTVSGAGLICSDPKLNADGTETAASPTIDAGSNPLIPAGLTTDLAGNSRTVASKQSGPRVDMGAFEWQTAFQPTPTTPLSTLGTATVSKAKAVPGGILVTVHCVGTAIQQCAINVTVTTTEQFEGSKLVALVASAKHHHKVVTIASASYRLKGGQIVTLSLKLNGKGKKLLKRFGKLPVRVLVTQTTGSGKPTTIINRTLTIKPPPPKRHR